MIEPIDNKDNENVFSKEATYYDCTRNGLYSFTDINGYNYTVTLEAGDIVHFDPFRIERRYNKEIEEAWTVTYKKRLIN